MIMYKAPYRVSLFGGGTDYKEYLEKNDIGMCIGFAIDKYSYISLRELPKFFPHNIKAVYSKIEQVIHGDKLEHNGIKHALQRFGLSGGNLEIHHMSDLPASVGLGTSSAFLVALCAALDEIKHGFDDRIMRTYLAAIASSAEQAYSNVGMQDHYFSSLGDCGELCFKGLEQIHYLKYPENIKSLFEKNGLLFFTGIERNASDTVGKYIHKLSDSNFQSSIFDIASQVSIAIARNKLTLSKAGQYLHETWELKKLIDESISNTKIDNIYYNVLDIGAYGGKLCGAGAGGCLFFLADPDNHLSIIDYCQRQGCIHIPFKISDTGVEKIL